MTRILTQAEVRALLDMEACMGLMERVLRALARGEGLNPLRWGVRLPEGLGILGMMPGMAADPEALGLKVVTVFPHNHGGEWDAHQGVVVLFDTGNGVPAAILDASEVTAIRTAAVSGVATRALARDDARVLALLGSGVQARTHLQAMALARPLDEVRVYSPTPAHREAFAQREGARSGLPVRAVGSAREAVEGADIVCTVTSSSTPVLEGAWLSPGTHVNAVGSSVRSARELDGEAVRRARFYVDRRESTLNESGDFLAARDEGLVDDDHIVAELGEVLDGRAPGRTDAAQITLFKGLGLAVEDLAAAHWVTERARAQGVGVEVPLGGRRHASD